MFPVIPIGNVLVYANIIKIDNITIFFILIINMTVI